MANTIRQLNAVSSALALAVFTTAALALPVESTLVVYQTSSAYAQYRQGDTVLFEERVTSSEYVVAADVPFPIEGTVGAAVATGAENTVKVEDLFVSGSAGARVSSSGASNVRIDAQLNASHVAAPHILRGEITQTMLPALPVETQHLEFAFNIYGAFIELWDNFGITSNDNPFTTASSEAIGGQIWYEVQRDGVTFYRSLEQIWGGRDSVYRSAPGDGDDIEGFTKDGLPLSQLSGGMFIGGQGDVPRGFDYSSVFNSLTGGIGPLDLGPVDRGEPFVVTATMGAEVFLPAHFLGAGARVNIGDPNALSGNALGLLTAETTAAPGILPVPGSGWLVLAGFLSLVGLRSFRQE